MKNTEEFLIAPIYYNGKVYLKYAIYEKNKIKIKFFEQVETQKVKIEDKEILEYLEETYNSKENRIY